MELIFIIDKNLICKTNFRWNPQKKGDFVTLSDDNRKININDEEYKYRSILGNQVLVLFKLLKKN